jgi:hypothetical protein
MTQSKDTGNPSSSDGNRNDNIDVILSTYPSTTSRTVCCVPPFNAYLPLDRYYWHALLDVKILIRGLGKPCW